MKKLMLILTILIVANVTYAQIPTEPDMINVYFDLNNYESNVEAPIYSMVPCYLIITNPTAASIAVLTGAPIPSAKYARARPIRNPRTPFCISR